MRICLKLDLLLSLVQALKLKRHPFLAAGNLKRVNGAGWGGSRQWGRAGENPTPQANPYCPRGPGPAAQTDPRCTGGHSSNNFLILQSISSAPYPENVHHCDVYIYIYIYI